MSELRKILKTTEKNVNILNIEGIYTLKDFFNYFPKLHEDRQEIWDITRLWEDEVKKQSIKVLVTEKKVSVLRNKKRIYEIRFEDRGGNQGKATYRGTWFVFQSIEKWKRYIVVGKPKIVKWKPVFSHPEFIPSAQENDRDDSDLEEANTTINKDNQIIVNQSNNKTELDFNNPESASNSDDYNIWRLYPLYSEMLGIKSARFAKKVWENMHFIDQEYIEYLPEEFREEFDLLKITDAIKNIHYPQDPDMLWKAKYRIYFDRLLKIQLQSMIYKESYTSWSNTYNRYEDNKIDRNIIKEFQDKLPYKLTTDQKKVIKQIIEDFHVNYSMIRLLQWDVWSGKTIVALICAYYIIKRFKWQVALIVPIEVLANQHYANSIKLFGHLGIQVKLLTWSTPLAQKKKIKQELKAWLIDIVIWTHAIIQDDVVFKNLDFVIVDEQHKFWVKQRSFFKKFGSPHILQMTATPIPRTLALAFFSEFEVSTINEMPAGRKPIITKIITPSHRSKLKYWILDRINRWQSVFVVVPLVQESDTLEWVHDVQTAYQEIRDIFSNISDIGNWIKDSQIGMMHGKFASKEKDNIMNKFKKWDIKILVSTTVIEVWVDVPEASIMIIKNAERFGLSQLHQLRGRVWRSDIQSYCFLETKNPSSNPRLQAMEKYTDGFKLAQIDMDIRWTGEVMWYRQSGASDIPIEILSDIKVVEKVQNAAKRLLDRYPRLQWLETLIKEIDYISTDVGL